MAIVETSTAMLKMTMQSIYNPDLVLRFLEKSSCLIQKNTSFWDVLQTRRRIVTCPSGRGRNMWMSSAALFCAAVTNSLHAKTKGSAGAAIRMVSTAVHLVAIAILPT